MMLIENLHKSYGKIEIMSVDHLHTCLEQNMLQDIDIVCANDNLHTDLQLFDFAGARLSYISSTPLETNRRKVVNRGWVRPVAILQLEGESHLTQVGKSCVLSPGSFAFVDAAKPYSLKHPCDFKQLAVQFPEHAFSATGWDFATVIPMKSQTPADRPFFECSKNLWEAAPFLHPLQHGAAISALLSLTKLTTAFSHHNPETETSIRVRRAMNFIENNLGDDNLSAEAVARYEGVSRRYLDELFVDGGHRINGWIWERRLARAADALALPDSEDRTLLQIAFDVGFKTPSHFSRAFSQRFGVSPREYRKRHLNLKAR